MIPIVRCTAPTTPRRVGNAPSRGSCPRT